MNAPTRSMLVILFLGLIAIVIGFQSWGEYTPAPADVYDVGTLMFSYYGGAFLMVGLSLLVAILGGVSLVKEEE